MSAVLPPLYKGAPQGQRQPSAFPINHHPAQSRVIISSIIIVTITIIIISAWEQQGKRGHIGIGLSISSSKDTQSTIQQQNDDDDGI